MQCTLLCMQCRLYVDAYATYILNICTDVYAIYTLNIYADVYIMCTFSIYIVWTYMLAWWSVNVLNCITQHWLSCLQSPLCMCDCIYIYIYICVCVCVCVMVCTWGGIFPLHVGWMRASLWHPHSEQRYSCSIRGICTWIPTKKSMTSLGHHVVMSGIIWWCSSDVGYFRWQHLHQDWRGVKGRMHGWEGATSFNFIE